MKNVRLRSMLSFGAVALLLAWTALGVAAESEKAREGTTVPIGLNGVPSQDHETDWAIAEEFQLDFFTTIFQWKEPKPGAYFWKEVKGEDPFKKHLQALKRRGYVVSLTNTTVHMDQKHLPKYLEGKPIDDPELLERWEAFLRAFLAEYGDSIDFLNLSNEVGSYFGGHREEWPAYLAFVRKDGSVFEIVGFKPIPFVGKKVYVQATGRVESSNARWLESVLDQGPLPHTCQVVLHASRHLFVTFVCRTYVAGSSSRIAG